MILPICLFHRKLQSENLATIRKELFSMFKYCRQLQLACLCNTQKSLVGMLVCCTKKICPNICDLQRKIQSADLSTYHQSLASTLMFSSVGFSPYIDVMHNQAATVMYHKESGVHLCTAHSFVIPCTKLKKKKGMTLNNLSISQGCPKHIIIMPIWLFGCQIGSEIERILIIEKCSMFNWTKVMVLIW